MSAYSDYKCGAISESEFKSAMRRECADMMPDYPPDPYPYTCQECEYCKNGERFVYDVVKRACDNKHVVKRLDRYAYTSFCVRDIEHIKEITGYEDVCEEHGELFKPEGE